MRPWRHNLAAICFDLNRPSWAVVTVYIVAHPLSGAIILWVSGCTFVSLLDRTPRSYICLLAGYTVLLAGLPLVNAPVNTFDIVVSRTEEIGLAIICASIVSHV
ncbi:Fusaric acid resistance protein family protein, partial [Rhizobium sp. AN5]